MDAPPRLRVSAIAFAVVPVVVAANAAAAVAADTPPPTTTATTAAPAKKPDHLKVLVLDVNSAELSASEKVTLANLAAAHLSEDPRLDVLSGEDVKQLVALSGQAQAIGVNGSCTDACMAELAGALGAGVVVSTQAGKLGDTLVVTLVVFDAAKAKSVSRKSITAASLGELPAKLGPALDQLVRPLLPQTAASVSTSAANTNAPITTTAPPPPTTAAPKVRPAMTGRVKELYDVESISICIDEKDKAAWWFCDSKSPYTENAFVRRYREVVGAHDLDRADQNRATDAWGLPIGMAALAVAGTGVTATALGCGLTDVCGNDLQTVFDPNAETPLPFIFGIVFGGTGAITGLVVGLTSLPDDAASEGTPQMHSLTEGEGRAGAARFNEALRDKLARDLGEPGS